MVINISDLVIISRIVLNIILPCSVISNFNNLKIYMSLLFLILIGIICDFVVVSAGYLAALKKSDDENAFNMINFYGYYVEKI